MPEGHPPPDPRTTHEGALCRLALLNAAAGVAHAEAYGRAAGEVGLGGALFARFATFAQVFAFCCLLALILSPLARVRSGRAALRVLVPTLFALLHALLLIDRTVFELFHFHLNRMAVGLVLAPGGLAALELSSMEVAILLAALGMLVLLEFLGLRWLLARAPRSIQRWGGGGRWRLVLGTTLGMTLLDRTIYAVAEYRGSTELARVAAVVPMYGPISVATLTQLLRPGGLNTRAALMARPRPGAGDPRYPLTPLRFDAGASRPSIVWVILDGWRTDAFDETVTPSLSRFAAGSTVFRNHVSGGIMTEFGLFSMFYGLHGVYHDSFAVARRQPVLLEALRDRGYRFGIFSSAGLAYPKARDSVFVGVPDLHDSFAGDGVDRDRAATDAAIAYLRARAADREPFLLVLFLDATHAPYSFPPGATPFVPFAESLRYVGMKDADPRLMRNRYLNSVRYDDGLAGELLASVEMLDPSTIVLATSDHGESLGEHGTWLHNTGFGPEQTRVPAILRAPGLAPGDRRELTRHVDLAPTLLALLGASNDPADFSVGRALGSDEAPATSAVACGWAACAIIEPDGRATVFPNLVEEDGTLRAQGPDYEPIPLSSVRGPSLLPSVLQEMHRFLR